MHLGLLCMSILTLNEQFVSRVRKVKPVYCISMQNERFRGLWKTIGSSDLIYWCLDVQSHFE